MYINSRCCCRAEGTYRIAGASGRHAEREPGLAIRSGASPNLGSSNKHYTYELPDEDYGNGGYCLHVNVAMTTQLVTDR